MASKSDRINRKRKKSRTLVQLAYLFFALILFFQTSYTVGFAFLAIAVVCLLIYPKYQMQLYYKHYKNFIAENYKEHCNTEITLELKEDLMLCKDILTESKIKIDAIKEIAELPDVFLLKMNQASNIVVPKTRTEGDEISHFISTLSTTGNIEIHDHTDWQWK